MTPPAPSDPASDTDSSDQGGPTDEEVVRTASEAAEGVIFDRYKQSVVRDFDVTVTFEDGLLEVDVYLNAPAGDEGETATGQRLEDVTDEAALAAQTAVDELFADESE